MDVPADIRETRVSDDHILKVYRAVEACAEEGEPIHILSSTDLIGIVLGERERCAKIAENNDAWPQEGADIAKAIRT